MAKEKKCECSTLDWITWILVLVGAINWGLVGVADVNVVSILFVEGSWLESLVYILIGLSALYWIYFEHIAKK